MQDTLRAGRVGDRDGLLTVYPLVGQGAGRRDRAERAQHERGEREGVDPEVEQGSTGRIRARQPFGSVGVQVLTVVGEDGGDNADETVLQRLLDHVVVGEEPAPHRFEQEEVSRLRQVDEVAGFARVTGEGLLDQNRLTRLEGEAGLSVMFGVRRRHVDDVDLRVGHQFFVGSVRRRGVELVGECLGAIEAAGADCDDLLSGTPPQRGGEVVGDPARRDDPPPNGGRRHGIGRAWCGESGHFCCFCGSVRGRCAGCGAAPPRSRAPLASLREGAARPLDLRA